MQILSGDTHRKSAIHRLQVLAPKLHLKSPDNRIEFSCLIYKFDLYQAVSSHELHDIGITSRALDSCGEMGDSTTVVHGIMKVAQEDKLVEMGVRSQGPKVWDSWMKMYNEVEAEQNQQIDLLG